MSNRMGETRTAYKIVFEKPEGARGLERPKHRWDDNIKVGLTELGRDRLGGFIRIGIEHSDGLS
jgi:hypothetical protein